MVEALAIVVRQQGERLEGTRGKVVELEAQLDRKERLERESVDEFEDNG